MIVIVFENVLVNGKKVDKIMKIDKNKCMLNMNSF